MARKPTFSKGTTHDMSEDLEGSSTNGMCGGGSSGSKLVFAPQSIVFNDSDPGTVSPPVLFRITNVGGTVAAVMSLSVSPLWTLSDYGPFTIPAGGYRDIAVIYHPNDKQIHAGEIIVDWDATADDRACFLVGAPVAEIIPGEKGDNGKSAYELAQAAGYTGTLVQWLASLIGPAGTEGTRFHWLAGFPYVGGVPPIEGNSYTTPAGFVDWKAGDYVIDPANKRLWFIELASTASATGAATLVDDSFGKEGLPGAAAPTRVKYRMSFFVAKDVQPNELLFAHTIVDSLDLDQALSYWRATTQNRPSSAMVLDVYGYGSVSGGAPLAAGAEIDRPDPSFRFATITIPAVGPITFQNLKGSDMGFDAATNYRILVFAPANVPSGMAGLAVTMVGAINLAAF